MDEAGRELSCSISPTVLLKKGHLEQVAQGHVQSHLQRLP